jgi:hypothetical protein
MVCDFRGTHSADSSKPEDRLGSGAVYFAVDAAARP